MAPAKAASVRPYFIEGLDFDALPSSVKVVLETVVIPTYVELVLEEDDGLRRSIGVSLSYLLWLEVIAQFQLSAQIDLTQLHVPSLPERDAAIDRYLRIVGSKQKAQTYLSRIRELRERRSKSRDGHAA